MTSSVWYLLNINQFLSIQGDEFIFSFRRSFMFSPPPSAMEYEIGLYTVHSHRWPDVQLACISVQSFDAPRAALRPQRFVLKSA